MDIRQITSDYAVSPQIAPEDMVTLAAAGFKVVINNRPDAEITPDLCCDEMRQAAEAAGLSYVPNPVAGITRDTVDMQGAVCGEADGPVFAYCRSGTRSSIVWALSQAGQRPTAEIVAALAEAGYVQPGLEQQIDMLASQQLLPD